MPPKKKPSKAPAQTAEQALLNNTKDTRRDYANVMSELYELETNYETGPEFQPALAAVGLNGVSDFEDFSGQLDSLVSRLENHHLMDRDDRIMLEATYGRPEAHYHKLCNSFRIMSSKVAALRVLLEGGIVKPEVEEESEEKGSKEEGYGEGLHDTDFVKVEFEDAEVVEGNDDEKSEEDGSYGDTATMIDVDELPKPNIRRNRSSKSDRRPKIEIVYPKTKYTRKRIANAIITPAVFEGFGTNTTTAQSIWEARFRGGGSGDTRF